MGLLDQVIRSALGSASGPQGGQGQSPIMMALLALLASRAMAGSASNVPAAGNVGGLGGLLERLQQGGLEDVVKSWVGNGPNQPVSPRQLHGALGAETVNDLSRETGMPQEDLLTQLSHLLPGVVDKLTPNGQLPAESELLAGPREAGERT